LDDLQKSLTTSTVGYPSLSSAFCPV